MSSAALTLLGIGSLFLRLRTRLPSHDLPRLRRPTAPVPPGRQGNL